MPVGNNNEHVRRKAIQKHLYSLTYHNPYIGKDHTPKTIFCRSTDNSSESIAITLFGHSIARMLLGLEVGDHLQSCERIASNDERIRNAIIYDFEEILAQVDSMSEPS